MSTTSSDSHSHSVTTCCASQFDTIAICKDLVQSVQQKVNTETGKHKTIRICTTCKNEGGDQHEIKNKGSP